MADLNGPLVQLGPVLVREIEQLPDIVLPVRPGDHNPELRYALRSLVNIPHGRVWIAGYMPHWVRGARCIPNTQNRSKYENSLSNLLAACRHEPVADRFILWNDDIFLLEPLEQLPTWHRGPLAEFVARMAHLGMSPYMRGVHTTAEILTRLGHPEALCYELHLPMPMDKAGVLAAHAAATAEGMPPTRALQIRSLYGNLAGLGGERVADVKVQTMAAWERGPLPFVSSTDRLWGHRHPAALHIGEVYPRPGPYEAPLPTKAGAR